jgi:hypothetical protein
MAEPDAMASESPPYTVPQPASMSTMIDVPSSGKASTKNRTGTSNRVLYDALNLTTPRPPDMTRRRLREPFKNTPGEREANKQSRSGRQLSELEILQDKHDSEFRLIVPVVADSLSYAIEQHAEMARSMQRDEKYAQYETNSVPNIQIEDYVHRIAEYTYISPATLVAALIYLDRLTLRHPSLLFTLLNIFKLFFVAVRVASKVVDLRTLNNKNFASVGGISNRHLNDLEAKFLIDIRFDLYVSAREFFLYCQRILARIPAPPSTSVPRPLKDETPVEQPSTNA